MVLFENRDFPPLGFRHDHDVVFPLWYCYLGWLPMFAHLCSPKQSLVGGCLTPDMCANSWGTAHDLTQILDRHGSTPLFFVPTAEACDELGDLRAWANPTEIAMCGLLGAS